MSTSETTAGTTAESAAARDVVPFRTAVRTWFAISLQTFGGPAGQIAVMQRALVEEKRWIGQQRFNHALSYCMLLPSPEAQQLAIYVGWLLNGTRGGLAAGTLFVLPGVVALLALSALYVAFGTTAAVTGLFAGLAPAVVVIVAQAVWRVGRRSLTHPALIALAVASFAALALFAVPFPLVVAVAALIGWLLARLAPQTLRPAGRAYGWLGAGEMVRGLALAETTPGPLIMVVQFVAFLGASRDPGALNPWAAALLGALLTTWVTFVPCFLFIFFGAPYIKRLRGNQSVSAALTGITAAVFGVIANLAVYFALHTWFAKVDDRTWGPLHLQLPDLSTVRPTALAITCAALVMVFGLKWSVLRVLGICAVLGLAVAGVTALG
ncbi:chromate transporter [Streptomyces afghaniensis]|uniref:chromate transporter n=1 Tax=Streptomyces afghaniensis TaxID=66865 RepID=UPI00379D626D